jgi:hypothetical protein
MSNASNSIDIFNSLQNPDSLASDIANKWSSWKMGRKSWETRAKEVTNFIYATSTKETTNATNGHSHSTHIPIVTMIKDNLDSNYLMSAMPNEKWFNFVGEDREASLKSKRDAVESYLRTKHRLSKFRNTISRLISDWTTYGNCFCAVDYVREFHIDPETNEKILGYVGPVVERISPYDIVFNVMATSFAKSPKIIRSVKTLGELARDVEERPELGYSEDVLNKVSKMRGAIGQIEGVDSDKLSQLHFDGFSSPLDYFGSGLVEILEFYGDIWDHKTSKLLKNHVITVVDKTWVVRSQPLNTWTGRPHIYHCGWRIRPDNLMAMGPLDNLIGMQYYINHVENAIADGLDQVLTPDRVLIGNVTTHYGANGQVEYEIPDGQGTVTNLLPDLSFLNADFRLQTKIDQMEVMAGAPREAMGIRTPGEKTAFEVQSLQNASGRNYQNKINYFEEEFLEDILNAELEVARRNLDIVDTIKLVDEDTGVNLFLTITKEDLLANGKLIPIGARHFAEQANLAQTIASINQNLDQEMRDHISSVDMTRALLEVSGADKILEVRPNVRVSERLESQRLMQTAQNQLDIESNTVVDDAGNVDQLDLQ